MSPPSAEGRHALLELVGDLGHVAQHVADEHLPRCVLREVRQVGKGVGHPLVADEQRRARQLRVDTPPSTPAPLPPPGAAAACRRPQAAQRVAGADQAVGGGADRARQ